MDPRFLREEMLLGPAAMERLHHAHVAVFGIGGVGGSAAEALVRGGIGRLTLVDGDTIALSNLNRQAFALTSTLGMPKVEAARLRLLDINPDLELHTIQGVYTPADRDRFWADYDYVIDAIDMVTSKLDLVVTAREKGIPIISSMGTGNKLDPSRLRVCDLYETTVCPLARVMRRELKKRGVTRLTVVASDEPPLTPAPPPEEERGARRAVPGSVSWVPPAAGLLLAGKVLRDLAKTED